MIERRDQLSVDEFHTRYREGKRPVIISDLVPPDWPPLKKWSLNYLKEVCGSQTVQVLADRAQHEDYELNFDRHRKTLTFKEYIEWIEANPTSNDIYIHAQNNFMGSPAGQILAADMPTLGVLDPARAPGNSFFWFGPAQTITPLHHDDDDILFVQVTGRKQWMLYPPRQEHLLYINPNGVHSQVDAEAPDLSKYPLFRFSKGTKFQLRPGEALYLPAPWCHHVRSLEVSISMSFTNLTSR